MKTWKYVGGHDAVDLAGVGTVAAGEPFATDVDLDGRDDFELVPDDLESLTVPKLRELAETRGIDTSGLKKKPDLIAALQKES